MSKYLLMEENHFSNSAHSPCQLWRTPLLPHSFLSTLFKGPMHLWFKFSLWFKMLVCISNFAANTVLLFHFYWITINTASTYIYQYHKCAFLIKHVSIFATYQSSANKHLNYDTFLLCWRVWSWDISWLEIFFLATFQMKGQRISQTRHRSTTPKEHHRITVSSSHWFQHCLIWFFLLLKMFAFFLHSRFSLARAFLLFSGISTCRHISFILLIKHRTSSILANRDR